ncbi:MAG: thymidylate synthase [Acidobacteriota bacterium]|nr:thymidylate synthase [Acidobacteriota bacterium]
MSHTETKGTLFSCLGELCWYLAGRNDLASIEYYLPRYVDSADDGIVHGGYGPRMLKWRGFNQLANVIECLKRKDSRQAVVQLFDAADIQEPKKRDVPCTCTLQFLSRRRQLSMLASLRSNDVFWGLPHDVFCFTMLQELVAKQMGLELGPYKHVVGSLHLYAQQAPKAQQYLEEGWQPTDVRMPPMPDGDPWPALRLLLASEEAIRKGTKLPNVDSLAPYWRDLVRLLEIYGCYKRKDWSGMAEFAERLHSEVYKPLVAKKLGFEMRDSGSAERQDPIA